MILVFLSHNLLIELPYTGPRKSGHWPAIRNLAEACNPNLNYARTSSRHYGEVVMLQNFGFGGQNSALVVKRWHG